MHVMNTDSKFLFSTKTYVHYVLRGFPTKLCTPGQLSGKLPGKIIITVANSRFVSMSTLTQAS